MEKTKSDRSGTEPETANPQESGEALGGQDLGEQPKPALTLVSDSSGESGLFATGAADDLDMYAAMLPRGHIMGRIKPRYLMVAGGVGLLLLGFAVGRHLPVANTAASPAESSPGPAPAPAAPAPSVAAIPAPTPVAVPLPVAAPVPVAAAPEPQAAAEPAPEPEQAAPPSTGAVEAQNVEGCRQAIKRRDAKLVNASCEAALAADPSLAKPLLSFAKGQFDRGKSAQAAVWARRIVQVNGSLADAYLIMGVADQEARRPAAAKAAYQRYLELAPKGPYAEDVRSSLKSL